MKCPKNHPRNAIYRVVSIAEGQTVKPTDYVGSRVACECLARQFTRAMERDGYAISYHVVISSKRDSDILL